MMKDLKGSPSRDTFKQKHKRLSKNYWACDLDFVLLEKNPFPDIVAAIDYKTSNDHGVPFSEVIAYNALIRRGIRVFIIQGDAETGPFVIREYVGGHHYKPSYSLVDVALVKGWEELGEWEGKLREEWRQRFSS